MIAWRHGSADIEAATRQGPNGAFTMSVPPLDTAATGDPVTAIDNSGNAIVAWPSSGSPVGIHFASHIGATWQPGSIANNAHQLLDPSLAANTNGNAVIAFHDMTLDVIAAVSGTVAGGFPSGPTDIKTLSSVAINHGPGVAIDNSGTALVGWTTATTPSNVQYSVKPAGGEFPAPGIVQTITPVPVSPSNFVLRGDGRGDLIATWYAFEGGHNAMRAAVKSGSSAGFGASQIISDPSKDTNDARIAFDQNGDAVVGLALFNGAPTGVEAAVYDASAPLIGAVTKPTSLRSGQDRELLVAGEGRLLHGDADVELRRWQRQCDRHGGLPQICPKWPFHSHPHRRRRGRQLGLNDVLGHGRVRPPRHRRSASCRSWRARRCPRPVPHCPERTASSARSISRRSRSIGGYAS